MEKNLDKNYLPIVKSLENIVENINNTKNFDFTYFYDHMEAAFKETGFREIQKDGVENILVIRLDAIGDFVLTTGFIRELRLNYPFARITLVVSKLVYPLAELCPYVNKVLVFEGKFHNNSDILSMFSNMSEFAAKYFWQEHYTSCFSVQWGSENIPALLMGYLSGARERIGYGYQIELLHFDQLPPKDKDISYRLLTKPVVNPKNLIHEAEKHLYVLTSIGLPIRSDKMELWYSLEDIQNARLLLSSIEPNTMKIVIGIGAGGTNRKYSIDQYINAFKTILKHSDQKISFIIIGGNAETEDAKKLQDGLPKESVLNLVNKTTLRETVAVLAQSDMYIGNVTGVMHMAAALNVPLITIYRQAKDKDNFVLPVFSEYHRFAPWHTISIELRPEHASDDCKEAVVYGGCKNPEPHCINKVKPKEIVEAFENLNYILQHNLSKFN